MPAVLEVQPIGAAGWVGHQHVNFPGVPRILICGILIHPHPQAQRLKCCQQTVTIMLEIVKHKGVLPVQLLQYLQKRLDLALVNGKGVAVAVIPQLCLR